MEFEEYGGIEMEKTEWTVTSPIARTVASKWTSKSNRVLQGIKGREEEKIENQCKELYLALDERGEVSF